MKEIKFYVFINFKKLIIYKIIKLTKILKIM